VEEPPQQTNPEIIPLHVLSQPLESLIPSSQVSLPTTRPSPHISVHNHLRGILNKFENNRYIVVLLPLHVHPGLGPEQSDLHPLKFP